MKTIMSQIADEIEKLKALMKDFFLDYSSIKYSPVNSGDSGFVVVGFSDYSWGQLSEDGKQIQARLYKEYDTFIKLAEVLISELPNQSKSEFEKNKKVIFEYIEQNKRVWESNVQEVFSTVGKSLDNQANIIFTLYDLKSDSYIFVPDTNSLINNQKLETWEFEGVQKFEILILPTVTSELDKLKVNVNKDLREKAQSIIRTFKEYRRRGSIIDGVNIVNGKISFRVWAIEPDFSKTLPWLDPLNDDDRIIAGYLEVMKKHPRSTVVLVTSDINLQNKAEFARLNFTETPIPKS